MKSEKLNKPPAKEVPHIKITDTSHLYNVYEFQEEIGRGSFGIVVSVIEKQNHQHWAIKIVNKSVAGIKLKSLTREIQVLKYVHHPNIIHLEKIFETTRKIYLVFEKCNSGALQSLFENRKPFPENVSKQIFLQLANAVAYLHKNGIVHRDIKLENILMAQNPRDPTDEYFIKLSDFGFSVLKTGPTIEDMLHEFCGTIAYMAPEILAKKAYSELCDVWACGVILYLLLYGTYPFNGSSDAEIMSAIISVELVCPSGFSTAEATNLIEKLLKKDPVERLTSLEVLEHPWITGKKMVVNGCTKDDNILSVMKRWRNEMRVPTNDDSDWTTVLPSAGSSIFTKTSSKTNSLQKNLSRSSQLFGRF